MADYRWYAGAALPGLESTALYHLKREGIVGFSPMERGLTPRRLYPGYIFVELESANEAGVVNRIRGMRKLLPIHAASPLPLPRGFVENLRELAESITFSLEDAEENLRRFAPGIDEVSASGAYPLRNGHGRFLRYHKGSGIVMGYLLGREVEVRIPLHQLAPAPATMDRRRGALAARAA
jgi:transcription antitermination factor NusG